MAKIRPIKYKQYRLYAVWQQNLRTGRDFATSVSEIVAHVEQLGVPFVNWSYYNSSDRRLSVPLNVDELCKKVLTPGFGNIRGTKPDWVLPNGCSALLFSEGGGCKNAYLDINLGQTRGGCSLTFPSKGEIAAQTLTTERIQQALEVLVKAQNPEWAVVDYSWTESKPSTKDTDIPVDWLIYTADYWRPIPCSLPSFDVHRIEGYGNYVITTPEPFDCDREDHQEAANRLKAMLIDSKVLLSTSS